MDLETLRVGVEFVGPLFVVLLGIYVKGVKADIKGNTETTNNTLAAIHIVDKALTDKIHGLETRLLKGYTPLQAHDEVRERLHKVSSDVQALKIRDEIRASQDTGRKHA